MTYLLALDQGTSSSRSIVFDDQGRMVAMSQREFRQIFPQPGWVEHDAEEIWQTQLATAREALAQAGVPAAAVAAIGITNQRETTVLWNRRTGQPLHHAIVWQDRRGEPLCAQLRADGLAPHIRQATGLVVDSYFSATKLRWLLDQVPGAREMAQRGELAFGTVDSWLLWKLTGGAVHATDVTNASRTMLYDLEARAWSPALCERLRVPMGVLPAVVPSSGVVGTTVPEALGVALPIAGIAGDQQAALFGQGGWAPGGGKNTYGTGAFLLLNTGPHRPGAGEGLLTTIACDDRGAPVYALEASIFIAGAAVQWLRDGLGVLADARESEALARSLPWNDGVYFVPALVGLGAPDWEPNARGTIVGLTRGTTRAHLVRAALEAMAYATRAVRGAMRAQGGVPFDRLRVDGGASANDWLMQFQADVLGVPVERPGMVETTALGAAGLAGLAVGVWPSASAFLSSQDTRTFVPAGERSVIDPAYRGWRRAVRAALAWARDDEDALP